MRIEYTTNGPARVGSAANLQDGWHYAYLRRQGNLASVIFDGDKPCDSDRWWMVQRPRPMADCRPVMVSDGEPHYFVKGGYES